VTPDLIRALTPCIGFISGALIVIAALVSGASGEKLTLASAIATASISGAVGLANRPNESSSDKKED
jgi:hypothetical protein